MMTTALHLILHNEGAWQCKWHACSWFLRITWGLSKVYFNMHTFPKTRVGSSVTIAYKRHMFLNLNRLSVLVRSLRRNVAGFKKSHMNRSFPPLRSFLVCFCPHGRKRDNDVYWVERRVHLMSEYEIWATTQTDALSGSWVCLWRAPWPLATIKYFSHKQTRQTRANVYKHLDIKRTEGGSWTHKYDNAVLWNKTQIEANAALTYPSVSSDWPDDIGKSRNSEPWGCVELRRSAHWKREIVLCVANACHAYHSCDMRVCVCVCVCL